MANKSIDVKLVLLGDSGVGKTSISLRCIKGEYVDKHDATIGASFLSKVFYLDDTKLKMQIWDTAGQERFRAMAPMYYRGASAALLVYDITHKSTFESMKEWVKELQKMCPGQDSVVLVIVGNKCDMEAKREVAKGEGEKYAKSVNSLFYEVSAKINTGIMDAFQGLAVRLVEEKRKKDEGNLRLAAENEGKKEATVSLDGGAKEERQAGWCCT